ncbi:MAG: hypothetical protein H0U16_07155 [Actinobacteria bacterium]|nr:hypothetical protein [Actinomycetota bacterium]
MPSSPSPTPDEKRGALLCEWCSRPGERVAYQFSLPGGRMYADPTLCRICAVLMGLEDVHDPMAKVRAMQEVRDELARRRGEAVEPRRI